MTTIEKKINDILKIESKFFVDIGASDVSSQSQSEVLLNHGWEGIMFECNEDKFTNQTRKMKDKKVKVLSDKVTPENILDLLEKNGVVDGFYLSIDIDGYDYFVIEKILTMYKPQMIISEINEKIPPPIKFSVLYNQNYWWNSDDFYGYSISMLEKLLQKYDYKIESLDLNNVILIPGTQEENIKEIYENGYYNTPQRHTDFSYNQPWNEIYNLNYTDQINFINNRFKSYENLFLIQ